jgi:hypothetical protein
VINLGKSALDARVKPVHDETESGSAYFRAFPTSKSIFPLPEPPNKRQNTLRPIKSN